MAHPNEKVIRDGLHAFASGDMEAMRNFLAQDVIWHSPGRNQLAGDYKGLDETLGLFGKLFEITGGTFRLEVHDVLANDDHGIILSTATAQREGRQLRDNGVQVLHLKDGKVTESWLHPGDQYAADQFFA
jgi:uncharacterized protein